MIAAGFDSNLLFYIIAAIIGLISWLTKKGQQTPPNDSSPMPKFPRPTAQPTEDERLRKFLDALGVPADKRPAGPVQRRQSPIAPRQPSAAPSRPVAVPPLPSPASEPGTRPFEAVPRAATRTAVPPKTRSLDEEPAPVLSVEQIHLPELQSTAVPEFVTASSTVSAIPLESGAILPREPDAYHGVHGPSENRAAARIGALLRNPEDLRAAILLREILGRPPGLQSSGALPTFP